MLYTLSCDFGNLPYVLFLTLSFWSHIVFLAGLLSAWNVGEGGLPSPQHLLTSLQGSTTGRLSKMLLSRRRLMCSLLGLWVGVPHVMWWCDVWSSEGLLLECMNPIQERRDAFQLILLEQKRCHSQDPWFLLSILAICPSQWYLFSKITCISTSLIYLTLRSVQRSRDLSAHIFPRAWNFSETRLWTSL